MEKITVSACDAARTSWNLISSMLSDADDYEDDDYRRKKRSREEKLDTMDRKLKAIENLIIEDTAKYYDNHEGW